MDDARRVAQFEKRARHLPHWEGPGETYFVTFCLRRPPTVDLTDPEIAPLVVGALRHFDGRRYVLYDYTVMPDHVHLIMRPVVCNGRAERLHQITHSLKSWLAHAINKRLGRSGRVWQEEACDHVIRNDRDYEEKSTYIRNNPGERGLLGVLAEWPWWGTGSGCR